MTQNQEPRTLLAIYAHPDDEAFGSGGTLAYYAQNGIRTALVCATRGEIGEISDDTLATHDNLGDVREEELRQAARALGLTDLIMLGYRDSGMAGTPDNDHPNAFGKAPADKVVPTLVGIIRRLRPQVIVTFDANGGYGHPDHIAAHKHAVAAFHAAGNPDLYPDRGEAWQPSRLFYFVFTRAVFENLRNSLESLGMDTSEISRWEQMIVLWADEDAHVNLDVSSAIEAKWQALEAHRTQFGADNVFRQMPEDIARDLMSLENFTMAWPETAPGTKLLDLFDGL